MRVPIGRPISNVQIHVLDDSLNQVPIGVPGELFIGGLCLAREYVNRPELTSTRFIDTPLQINSSPRLYKTGDLVRWLSDGNIEYLGRLDSQVKIRGFRIELGEIEHRLGAHKDVVDVVVKTVDIAGETQLAAYYTVGDGLIGDDTELRRYLLDKLPEYMVPSFFLKMEKIPLNSSGKADRKMLPDPKSMIKEMVLEPPSSELEHKLSELWKQILSLECVGRNQNFFELGGTSLSVVTMLLSVKNQFPNGNVSQVNFYNEPTIEGLSKLVLTNPSLESNSIRNLSSNHPSESDITIICCPYAGASTSIFQSLPDHLDASKKKVAVLAVLLPGNEIGDVVESELSIQEIADNAAKDVINLKASNIVVYGHCVGGLLAFELARRIEDQGLTIHALVVGGSLPFPKLFTILPISNPWRFVSDRQLTNLIKKWGGAVDGITNEVRYFLTKNFRKDVKAAFLYQKKLGNIRSVSGPIVCIFSKDDPLTRGYTKKYLMWNKFSKNVHLVTIENGKHYFVGEKAGLVSSILLQVVENINHLQHSNHTRVVVN